MKTIDTIGIIGGTGQMGRMFHRCFSKIGKKVLVSDQTTISSEKNLVENSDLVIISVPIDETVAVVKRIDSWLKEDQLLSDFTSVKNDAVPAMLRTKAAVISCHPMFGNMKDISKQNLIVMPIRARDYLLSFCELFEALDLSVEIIKDWKKHDEAMSFIQGLMHFIHIVFTQTLKSKNADLATILSICSPVYQANFAFTCRIIQRDPHLYTHILMDNPENINVLNDFVKKAQESIRLLQKKDQASFKENFLEARDYLGEYGKLFSNQSEFLVEKIKEFPETDG